jgi:hypothetical protein
MSLGFTEGGTADFDLADPDSIVQWKNPAKKRKRAEIDDPAFFGRITSAET